MRFRPTDYRTLPVETLEKMARNNPYIKRIYDYPCVLIPHPTMESFSKQWQPIVSNQRKVHVEIGCGSGRYLIQLAKNNPQDAFLGLELRLKRLVLAARKIERDQIINVLLMRERGEYLDDYFTTASIDVMHVNFPDPWSKEKRRKHRVLSEPFLEMMHCLFKQNGELHFKTDHLEYFSTVTDIINSSGLFRIADSTLDLHNSLLNKSNIYTEFELLFKSKGNPPIGYFRAILNE